jgi:D-amino-acid oxidase
MKQTIKIIGCGVSGLSVGITLLEQGYAVEIITDKMPAETTSAVAAAIWFPYAVNPREKVNKWSKIAYHTFKKLSEDKRTGVSMNWLSVLIEKEEDSWWKGAIPEDGIRKAAMEELPVDFPLGYKMYVPLIETPIYLQYLLDRFLDLNGGLVIKKVDDISDLISEGSILINCTGLGAQTLFQDKNMYPIYGQIVKAEVRENVSCVAAELPFEGTFEKAAYIIPRRDCIVLGGTAIKGKEDITPNEVYTQEILQRCKQIDPALSDITIQSVVVGLRPGRSEIRLEWEGERIIHNYGHGGAGFTVSWGCAAEVLEMISKSHD